MCRSLFVTLVLLFALLTGACSTIVEGTDQSVTVITDPPGASCALERDGQIIGHINPTPGTISVSKSKDTIAVTCDKEEHLTGASVLASEFQDMTVGNLLFGGLIGVAVDASSGAMNEYPPSVTVIMPPESFPSADERDAYFDQRITTIDEQHEKAVAAVSSSAVCTRDSDGSACTELILKVDEKWLAETERLQAQRNMVLVEPSTLSN